MLPEKQLRREGAILAGRLVKSGGWLERHAAKGLAQTGWVLKNPKTGRPVRGGRMNAELVDSMLARGWLVRRQGGEVVLSAAGTAALLAPSRQPNSSEIFASQHQSRTGKTIRTSPGAAYTVCHNETESPLSWMRARKGRDGKPLVSDEQYDAGERIRADFTFAGLSPRITASWDFTGAGARRGGYGPANLDMNDRVIAARQRFHAALDALGPELSPVVIEVCCLANGLEAAERTLGWPRRSAKLVLLMALSCLARHYKLDGNQPQAGKPAHWRRPGYRPQIPPAG
ncbi:MAG TPA: hypothetical protein ENJ99_04565 [Rhizobiales bacterium]|nr:hypothetical protein [Hyphomicrobiales bacterium]